MPTMPAFNQAARAEGADFLGAAGQQYQGAMGQYSADQAASQGLMSGIGTIASAAMMFSDRRLKKNIRKIGKMLGLNLYSYDYVWNEPAIGFMADEVAELYPEAVDQHPIGYDMIDYHRIIKEA